MISERVIVNVGASIGHDGILWRWCDHRRERERPVSFGESGQGHDLVFYAEAPDLDYDDFGVVEDTVACGEYRAGDAGIVIEDLVPVFVGFVGGDNQRVLFTASADCFKELFGARPAEREMAIVNDDLNPT